MNHNRDDTLANFARIVACVNACQGIAHPEAIGDVVKALQSLMKQYETLTNDGWLPSLVAARQALSKLRGEG